MNSQVADDFHAALLAMQDIETDRHVDQTETDIAELAEQVFAFLEGIEMMDEPAFAPLEKIAA